MIRMEEFRGSEVSDTEEGAKDSLGRRKDLPSTELIKRQPDENFVMFALRVSDTAGRDVILQNPKDPNLVVVVTRQKEPDSLEGKISPKGRRAMQGRTGS